MTPTFIVYVDESGDEGFSFDRGSSDWFVVSAAVTRKASDLETVKLVDTVRTALGKPPKAPLHFRDLRHEQRLPFVEAIRHANLSLVSVLIHKRSIKEPEKFRERYRLYFYAIRYLLERVSWYCRDHRTARDSGDGSAEVILSNRSGLSYDELSKYLELLENQTGWFDVRVDWNVIRPNQVHAFSPPKRMGLLLADAAASSFFFAVNQRYGFTESRYAEILKPVVYNYRGTYLGYGVKFWPKETDELLRADENLRWVRETYT